LPDQVEKLGRLRGFGAVAIDSVSIASGSYDLETKTCKAHSEEGDEPENVILEGEAVNQETCGEKKSPCPDGFEPDFWGWIFSCEVVPSFLNDPI
jgi:hypothetical protein